MTVLVTVSFRALEAEKLNEQAAVANPEEVVSMVEMWVSISFSLSSFSLTQTNLLFTMSLRS